MKSRAYRGRAVNRLEANLVGAGRHGQALTVGIDVGKYELVPVARWADCDLE